MFRCRTRVSLSVDAWTSCSKTFDTPRASCFARRASRSIAVATLALAIGATTAVFSIVDGVLLKPLPFRDSERAREARIDETKPGSSCTSPCPTSSTIANQTHSFAAVAQMQDGNSANLRVAGADPMRLNSAAVGARFFDLLGAPMELGRGFIAGEDEKGARHGRRPLRQALAAPIRRRSADRRAHRSR